MHPASPAESGGTWRAALRIIVASTGLRLCGMAEELPRPATSGSPTSPTSVRHSDCTSTAILPSAPVVNASTAARSATGVRRECHGVLCRASPVSAAKALLRASRYVPSAVARVPFTASGCGPLPSVAGVRSCASGSLPPPAVGRTSSAASIAAYSR